MRPSNFHVGGVLYWVIRTRNPDTMALKDADSTPTVAVRKNGAATGDSVTVTKRSATTGIYDCSYNPASEIEDDSFTLEESATVTGTTTASATYTHSWTVRVFALARGTDGANTITPDNASVVAAAASAASADAKLTAGRLSRVDRLPDINAGSAGGVALVGSAMSLDSSTLTALFADADVAGMVAQVAAAMVASIDDSGDISVQAIAAYSAQLTLAAILADGSIITLLSDASEAAGDAATAATQATTAATQATAANAVATKLNTGLVLDGSVYQWTANALELAPAGGGGGGETDWTDEEKAQIRYRLGLNGTATAPTEPVPDPIVITPGSDNITTAWLVTRVAGVATAGITIRYQQIQEPDDDTGSSYDSTIYEVESGANFAAEMPMVRGGYYYAWRGPGKRPDTAQLLLIPADAGATYELPSHVGR